MVDDNQFIDAVARRSGMSTEQATALIRATLTTVAERIDGGEARDLAAQLPTGLRPYAFAAGETAERFGFDVFVQRIAGRADIDPAVAEAGARAVFDSAEYDDVVSQLPAELAQVANPVAPFNVQQGRS